MWDEEWAAAMGYLDAVPVAPTVPLTFSCWMCSNRTPEPVHAPNLLGICDACRANLDRRQPWSAGSRWTPRTEAACPVCGLLYITYIGEPVQKAAAACCPPKSTNVA